MNEKNAIFIFTNFANPRIFGEIDDILNICKNLELTNFFQKCFFFNLRMIFVFISINEEFLNFFFLDAQLKLGLFLLEVCSWIIEDYWKILSSFIVYSRNSWLFIDENWKISIENFSTLNRYSRFYLKNLFLELSTRIREIITFFYFVRLDFFGVINVWLNMALHYLKFEFLIVIDQVSSFLIDFWTNIFEIYICIF